MEFEAGESIIAPEMYESYGYSIDSRPSDLHANRAKDRDGNFIGFNAERRFSENCLVQFDLEDGELSFSPDTCRSGYGPGESAAEGTAVPGLSGRRPSDR